MHPFAHAAGEPFLSEPGHKLIPNFKCIKIFWDIHWTLDKFPISNKYALKVSPESLPVFQCPTFPVS